MPAKEQLVKPVSSIYIYIFFFFESKILTVNKLTHPFCIPNILESIYVKLTEGSDWSHPSHCLQGKKEVNGLARWVTFPQLVGEEVGRLSRQGKLLFHVLCSLCVTSPSTTPHTHPAPAAWPHYTASDIPGTSALQEFRPQLECAFAIVPMNNSLFTLKSWLGNLKNYLPFLYQSPYSAHIIFWSAIEFMYFLCLLSFSCLLPRGKKGKLHESSNCFVS